MAPASAPTPVADLIVGPADQVAVASTTARSQGWSRWIAALRRTRSLLPDGRGLDEAMWRRRHHVIVTVLWLHVPGLALYGSLRGYGVLHSLSECVGLAVLAIAASQPRGGRTLRSTIASSGLMVASALVVHFSTGSIEAHFHFFVMIALLSLYQDWIPLLVALAFVVLHHGAIGYLHPHDVYDHSDAEQHPWLWACIHGGFVLAAACASIYSWRASEEDHHRADAETRRSEEAFRALFEKNPQPMWVFDLETLRFLAVNPAAEAAYGYTEEEFLTMCVSEIRPPEHVGTFIKQIQVFGEGNAGVWTHRTKSGDDREVVIHSQRLHFHGRDARLSVMFDITERMRLERDLRHRAAELESSNRELEQFAYVSAHDLQEPLRMVASYVQLLDRRYHGKLDGDADEYIAFAVEGATRMQSLITDLLSYSQVGRGHAQLSRIRPLDCVNVARSNLAASITASRAQVTCEELPEIEADPKQLSQLFQNLIGNAIKFRGEAPPRIDISAARENGSWVFSVRDNGIGIPADHHEKVFAMFQRLNSREMYPGTGIGLAICRKIVDLHAGSIWVDSEVGRGSTFRFALPADARPEGTRYR